MNTTDDEEKFELGDTLKISLKNSRNYFDAVIRQDNWLYIYLGKSYLDKFGSYGLVNVEGMNFIKSLRASHMKESKVILIEKNYKFYGKFCACLKMGDGYFNKSRYRSNL